ncbi:MAG: M23 family metallopeptidase [Treponema sp.]|jgi:hypothetical protein|nr:M23 family metallopeptidase [Treponema sp.]
MKKKVLLKRSIGVALFLLAAAVSAFDWPQQVVPDSFYSYFGQLRGGTLSSSLIFSEPGTVKSAETGRVLIVMTEHNGDYGWFESTLGNAVVLEHRDDLLTVYGNLGSIDKDLTRKTIDSGAVLGETGNSGWQQGKSCLEFQVLDAKSGTAINPRTVMPRIGREPGLKIDGITAVDASGRSFSIPGPRPLAAGKYRLYKNRQKTAVPFATTVSLNGAAVEELTYDILVRKDNRLCLMGRKPYSVQDMYPDAEKQLLGNILLPHGRDILSVTVKDILGTETTVSYTVPVN